jgi:thioredoxin-like negative regulator of GroEL
MTSAAALCFIALLGSGPGGSGGIRWERDFDAALRKAQKHGKPVMVDFWAEWCGWCHRLDEVTYRDPAVARRAADFVAVKVNSEGSRRETEVAGRYDVQSLPTVLFLTPAGRPVFRLAGYQGPAQFARTQEQALEKARTVMGWEDALARDPKAAAALSGLGAHLFEQESFVESRELLRRAVEVDATEPVPTRQHSRLLLAMIQNYDRRYPDAEGLLKEALELKPPGPEEPRLLYVLARTYTSWGKGDDAERVLKRIVKAHPSSPFSQKAIEMLRSYERR